MSDQPATKPTPQPPPNAVVTECDLPDAPEKVWRALTVPKLLAAWLPEASRSEILEAQPDRLLRYRWIGNEQDKDADGRRLESVVTFELTGAPDGGTHLRVVHRVVEEARVIPFAPRSKTRTLALAGSVLTIGGAHTITVRPAIAAGAHSMAPRRRMAGACAADAFNQLLLRRAA